MATIINNPDSGGGGGGSAGTIIGIVVAIIIIALFFLYGLPALRGTDRNNTTNIEVPDRIQVDVNK